MTLLKTSTVGCCGLGPPALYNLQPYTSRVVLSYAQNRSRGEMRRVIDSNLYPFSVPSPPGPTVITARYKTRRKKGLGTEESGSHNIGYAKIYKYYDIDLFYGYDNYDVYNVYNEKTMYVYIAIISVYLCRNRSNV